MSIGKFRHEVLPTAGCLSCIQYSSFELCFLHLLRTQTVQVLFFAVLSGYTDYIPLLKPDYEIDHIKKKVVVRIYGNEINKRYTDLLKTNDTLSLWDCISLDAVQKGRIIHEDVAQDLLKRGLIEGEAPHYSISLSMAKNTHQLPSYTKTKGLDKERLRQMVLQYLSNAGDEGAKRDSIYEYLKDVLPQNKTEEQQLRLLGDLLKTMKLEEMIKTDGRNWYLL